MKKIYKDKKGSSLVFALIAMSFVALLAVAVITMTVTNIRLKDTAKNSQKNLYSADGVIDCIKAGIQDLSSDSSASAYKESLSSYSKVLSGGASSVKEIYDAAYLKQMVIALSGADTFKPSVSAYKYKDEVIRSYLDAVQSNSYKSHPGGKGEMVYDNGTLTLKDIEVTATINSYKTRITTDIHIDIPPMTTETNAEYLDYSMIADNQIIADQSGTNNILGNVYAGTVERDSLDPTKETGIYVNGGATLNIEAENIITRGDIAVNNNSSLYITGSGSETANVWVENIVTSGGGTSTSGGNTLSINGECNVADDLSIDGENDSVSLFGGYYGYNYNESYDGANVGAISEQADYSSAILINGKKCSLNMENLDRLVLSGRTFISKNSNSESYLGSTKPVKNKDIITGESLTVKGSQLAYLVEKDYWAEDSSFPVGLDKLNRAIYFKYKDDESDSDKEYVFRYGEYMDSIGLTDVDLLDYIDINSPLVYYYRNDTAVSPKPVTYFYLNFKSLDKSSEFYKVFMEKSTKKNDINFIEKRFMSDTVGIRINDSAIMMRSGNIVYKDGSSDDIKIKLTNESISADSGLALYAKTKSKEYMSRQLSLIDDYDVALQSTMWRLASDPSSTLSKKGKSDNTNLFDMLVQRSKLPSTGTERNNIEGGLVAIASDDFTWDDSERSNSEYGGCDGGIIIAKGDVTLMRDFKGLIIAGGDVKFGAAGIKAESDTELVTKMFGKDKGSASPLFYDKFTKYFRNIVDSTIGSDTSKNKDNVQYENWKRN